MLEAILAALTATSVSEPASLIATSAEDDVVQLVPIVEVEPIESLSVSALLPSINVILLISNQTVNDAI